MYLITLPAGCQVMAITGRGISFRPPVIPSTSATCPPAQLYTAAGMTALVEIRECVGNYKVLDKPCDGYGLKSGQALVVQARRARGLKERGPNDQTVLCVYNTPKALADLKN